MSEEQLPSQSHLQPETAAEQVTSTAPPAEAWVTNSADFFAHKFPSTPEGLAAAGRHLQETLNYINRGEIPPMLRDSAWEHHPGEYLAGLAIAWRNLHSPATGEAETVVAEQTTNISQSKPQKEQAAESLKDLFNRDCHTAGFNVFQLVDCQVAKTNTGDFVFRGNHDFRDLSDSYLPIQNFVRRSAPRHIVDQIEERSVELFNMQRRANVDEEKDKKPRVGNSIVLLTRSKDGTTRLIVYGTISAETMGSWRGGRANSFNSIVFQLHHESTASQLLSRLDTAATGYDEGTARNYEAIYEAMSGVFPLKAMEYATSHMFHRQEIMQIVDLRDKQVTATSAPGPA